LRDLRRLADNARNDLRDGLGPEFGNFDVNDLNPRNFVRKHLMEDLDGDPSGAMANGDATNGSATNSGATNGGASNSGASNGGATNSGATNGETINAGSTLGSTAMQTLTPGERPPYDSEAT
jgi:sec-independent protein translocase protein TatB